MEWSTNYEEWVDVFITCICTAWKDKSMMGKCSWCLDWIILLNTTLAHWKHLQRQHANTQKTQSDVKAECMLTPVQQPESEHQQITHSKALYKRAQCGGEPVWSPDQQAGVQHSSFSSPDQVCQQSAGKADVRMMRSAQFYAIKYSLLPIQAVYNITGY